MITGRATNVRLLAGILLLAVTWLSWPAAADSAAIDTTRQDNHRRHLRECHLSGGLYECTVQSLPEGRVLLELNDMKMEQQALQLQNSTRRSA